VPGSQVPAIAVVGEHGIHFGIWQYPINQDNRHVLTQQEVERIDLVAGCDEDNPIDLLLAQYIYINLLSMGITFGIAQDHGKLEGRVPMLHHFGEEGI
jgi:hypothetical protein